MRHFISIADLTREDALAVLATAEHMAQTQSRSIRKLPTLVGTTVVNLFFEDSTRTRISFEAAAKRLSADVINFSAKGSSISKGESLKDTALTLQAMGADAVVVRSASSGAAHLLAHSGWIDQPIINAGDGAHEHPTQAMLDAFTMRRHLRPEDPSADLAGAHVVIVGDVLHSRVARSAVCWAAWVAATPPLRASLITSWPSTCWAVCWPTPWSSRSATLACLLQ